MKFSMSSIKKSNSNAPLRVLIYGDSGAGKTTAACSFENPILLRTEDGARGVECDTFPELITSLSDLSECFGLLDAEQHSYKTLVIDSLDWLEPLVWDAVCKQEKVSAISQLAYGKGYALAADIWRKIIAKLELLRQKTGMDIVVVCHAQAVQVDSPETDQGYQRMDLKLHKAAAALWKEWADTIAFLHHKIKIVNSQGQARGRGDGTREVCFNGRPNYVAKSRTAMPDKVEVNDVKEYKEIFKQLKGEQQ